MVVYLLISSNKISKCLITSTLNIEMQGFIQIGCKGSRNRRNFHYSPLKFGTARTLAPLRKLFKISLQTIKGLGNFGARAADPGYEIWQKRKRRKNQLSW